ncbi:hypothetical protein LCGC14_3082940 [marine sediment metagenome]|uniref:Uncharacterized protein n=1 Tax=marine sediment metagenome TaxID=412755 RepID=A0A0F8X1C0_9ZZZZ
MSHLQSFARGMRAYHDGDHALATEVLTPLSGGGDVPAKISRYYCAMAHRAIAVELIGSGGYAEAAGLSPAALGSLVILARPRYENNGYVTVDLDFMSL